MIKKISSACLLFTILSLVIGSCSTLEQNSTFEISNQYDVYINRDFWGVPYIKGQTDQDVAYGIGLVHAEDAYEDLVELMPLYRGQNAIYNGLDHYKLHFDLDIKASIPQDPRMHLLHEPDLFHTQHLDQSDL